MKREKTSANILADERQQINKALRRPRVFQRPAF
jgi:hypothetical protein